MDTIKFHPIPFFCLISKQWNIMSFHHIPFHSIQYYQSKQSLNFGGGKGLVKKSASCSSMEIGSNFKISFCTFSVTKWQSISRCFVLSWNIGLEAMCIAPWLSQYKTGCLLHVMWRSFERYKSILNHFSANNFLFWAIHMWYRASNCLQLDHMLVDNNLGSSD